MLLEAIIYSQRLFQILQETIETVLDIVNKCSDSFQFADNKANSLFFLIL